MKHAYLIIAHNEPILLKRLLASLDDVRNDIFLHIDKKSIDLYHFVTNKITLLRSNLYIIHERIDIRWGDISQVETELLLMEKALSKGNYEYLHLLSGVDYPIKSQDYIHDFFTKYGGKEFIGFAQGENNKEDLERKTKWIYLFTGDFKQRNPIRRKFTSAIRSIFLSLQKTLKYHRKYPCELKKGAQWFSITSDLAKYLIDNKTFILNTFKHIPCCDEIFLQTMVWNSPFKCNIYNTMDEYEGNMRLIDWDRGNPYVWKSEDIDEILQSNKLFARKLSSTESRNLINSLSEINNEAE